MLTDNDPMLFGIHKGKAMANVPDDYLIYLLNNNKCNDEIKEYILDNINVIEHNTKKEN